MEVQMDSPSPTKFKILSIPNTPLAQVSEARINQQRLPQSPSLPTNLYEKTGAMETSNSVFSTPMSSPQQRRFGHAHRNSDVFVRSRIEIFENGMTGQHGSNSPIATSPVRQSTTMNGNTNLYAATNATNATHAALQRAVLGREEAEAALSSTLSQLQEAQLRERRIAERVESLMEELAGVKERQGHERQVFEKEVRKVRKEAFKSSSVMVKCQEELKEVKGDLTRARGQVDRERAEKESARQEAFERAYTVAGLVEELEAVKEKLKAHEKAEEERETQKKTDEMFKIHQHEQIIQEEKRVMKSMATQTEIAAEQERRPLLGNIQAPRPTSSLSDRAAKNTDIMAEEVIVELKKQLSWVKTLKTRDEDLIEFMQVQCQFRACPCRVMDMEGEKYVHGEGSQTQKTKGKFVVGSPVEGSEPRIETGSISSLQEPATVPLPRSPEADNTPDPTAMLEEMTQVLIQPVAFADAKTFSFSTSTSSMHKRPVEPTDFRATVAPTLRSQGSQSILGNTDDDLFSLSPPKKMPTRPSTALGLSSATKSRTEQLQQSPIRVVPHSPKSPVRTVRIPGSRPKSAMSSHTPASSGRKLQLRSSDTGSPVRRSVQRHTRSPTPASTIKDSVSPNAPASPVFHMANQGLREQTTTTMVPLRGLESDDVFSPVSAKVPAPWKVASVKLGRAETMPLPHDVVDNLDIGAGMRVSGGSDENVPLSMNVPGTPVSRAEALRQIRERRDRARSVHMRSQSQGREKSAGAPGSVRRGINLGGLLERGREVSQASAPGRM